MRLCAYNNIYNNEMSRTGTQYDLRAIYSVPRPSADLRSPHPPQKTISPPPASHQSQQRVYIMYTRICAGRWVDGWMGVRVCVRVRGCAGQGTSKVYKLRAARCSSKTYNTYTIRRR